MDFCFRHVCEIKPWQNIQYVVHVILEYDESFFVGKAEQFGVVEVGELIPCVVYINMKMTHDKAASFDKVNFMKWLNKHSIVAVKDTFF